MIIFEYRISIRNERLTDLRDEEAGGNLFCVLSLSSDKKKKKKKRNVHFDLRNLFLLIRVWRVQDRLTLTLFCKCFSVYLNVRRVDVVQGPL